MGDISLALNVNAGGKHDLTKCKQHVEMFYALTRGCVWSELTEVRLLIMQIYLLCYSMICLTLLQSLQ